MTAEEFYLLEKQNKSTAQLMTEFARLKCLEAIRNTRCAAIEIVQSHQDSQFDIDRILNFIERDIMNIDNNEVLPNL